MNRFFPKLVFFLVLVYAASFAVTYARIRFEENSGLISGVRAPGLVSGRLSITRELSDVVQIPGGPTALMVEDEVNDRFFSMQVTGQADTDGPIVDVLLPGGFTLKDMEGVAVDTRGFVYVVSSHSLNSAGKPRRGSALARMKWMDGKVGPAETVADLRPWLQSVVPEIAAVMDLAADSGGLNIEGLAYDPNGDRLLLGLRGPLIRDHPAIIPIHLIAPTGPFRRESLDLQPMIRLDGIENFGIRAVSWDPVSRGFWILTGGGGESAKTKNKFHLWFWNGSETQPVAEPVESIKFEKELKVGRQKFKLHPEGICVIHNPGARPFLLVVTDGSPAYFKMDVPAIFNGKNNTR